MFILLTTSFFFSVNKGNGPGGKVRVIFSGQQVSVMNNVYCTKNCDLIILPRLRPVSNDLIFSLLAGVFHNSK